MRGSIAALSGLLLAGCTTSLSVSEIGESPAASRPTTLPAGFVYHLPAAVVTPTAFVAIRECPLDPDAGKYLRNIVPQGAKPVKEVTFVVGGSVAATQVPDQMIVIDFRGLQKFLKTSSLSLERWPNGMLKSVNTSIEDQTPQAIASVAAAAGSFALLASGAPGTGALLAAAPGLLGPAGANKTASVNFLACNARTLELVAARKVAAASRETATSLLDQATTAATELGAKPNADAAKLDALKAAVAKYAAQSDKATSELAVIDAQLNLPLDMVGPKGGASIPLPDSGAVAPSLLKGGIVLTSSKLNEYLDAHFVEATAEIPTKYEVSFNHRACAWSKATGAPAPDETCTGRQALSSVLGNLARVEVNNRALSPIVDTGGDGRPASSALASTRTGKNGLPQAHAPASSGIIYVEPAKLRLEMTAYNVGPQALVSRRQVIKTADVSIPQLGQYLVLPLRADFGERAELKATFAEDGSLLTATFANPKTSGMAIADTLRQLGATAVTSRDAMEDRRLKLAKTKSETLAALVAAQDSAKKLTPTADPLADINAALAKANAEAALAEAEVRIQAARAKLVTP